MAHQRARSTSEAIKGPHSVSLKVLRLSRPSLAHSLPLPRPSGADGGGGEFAIPVKASLAYPTAEAADPFIASPLLKLPEAFGSAYVGEAFSCTLCANNELAHDDAAAAARTVSGVRISAEMQTPSTPSGVSLALEGGDGDTNDVVGAGRSVQRILAFHLTEEGSHTLAVTVTYTETQMAAGDGNRAAGGRVRTFRKLYQFVAQHLVSVKTKTSELESTRRGDGLASRFVLEAQIENLGEGSLSLEPVDVDAEAPFKAISLNVPPDAASSEEPAHLPVLGPGDVSQVAFIFEQQKDGRTEATGRRMLVRNLLVQWRSPLGGRGSLRVGPLFTRTR